MRIAKYSWLLTCAWLALPAFAEPVQTLNLKPFAGQSQVEKMGAEWILPHGRQVLDGIPFQMDGTVVVQGTNALQLDLPKSPNATEPSTNLRFERIHLLAAADNDASDATTLANVRVGYADGTQAVLPIRYGEHTRSWTAPWHKTLTNSGPKEVWHGPHPGGAQSDIYLRFYHVSLTNTSPEKEVRSVALESVSTRPHLMVMAVSFGPTAADVLADTVTAPKSPFPDLRPRTGEPARGEGIVENAAGQPLPGAHVRVMASREFNTQDRESSTSDPAVGLMVDTGAEGHFVLPPLPDNRLYRLGVMADDFEFATYRGVDPKSDPVEIRLKPLSNESKTGKFAVRGKVLGPDGRALAFARVEPDGVGVGGGTSWGGNHSFPEVVLTGTNGEFVFARNEKFDRLQVEINADGCAPTHLWLTVSNETQTVRMSVGADLRGRVLKDGQPLANVGVGVVGQDRNSENFAGHFDATTGTNGVFVFSHLPPDTAWNLFGVMSSLKPYGALVTRPVRSGASGEATDLGDLNLVPAVHIAGQVKTRHGEPLPGNLKLLVGIETGWDSQSVDVGADGRFRVDGLGKETITLWLRVAGWQVSGVNRSIDVWNPGRLIGQLEGDRDDLLFVIEKGDPQYNNYNSTGNGQLPQADLPQNRPLYGAEPSGPPSTTLAGRVLDDKTGLPILKFKIIPGRKPPVTSAPAPPKPMLQNLLEPFSHKSKAVPWNEKIYWEYAATEEITNGNFSVDFMVLTGQPVLQIEAEGYQPLETEPMLLTTTNLVLRLQRGVGPNGIVLLPNGQPAAGASVVYGSSQEQFSMNGAAIDAYGSKKDKVITAGDGKFSFEPKTGGMMLFVAHPAGWAQESVEKNSGAALKIRLQPWASVTGILVNSNNVPLVGTNLHLTMFRDWQQNGSPMVNLQYESTTDAQGRFIFTNVPPSRIELQREIRFGGPSGGYSYQLQTWLVPEAGTVTDLGKVTLDHPPPEPVMDQLKHRLGL